MGMLKKVNELDSFLWPGRGFLPQAPQTLSALLCRPHLSALSCRRHPPIIVLFNAHVLFNVSDYPRVFTDPLLQRLQAPKDIISCKEMGTPNYKSLLGKLLNTTSKPSMFGPPLGHQAHMPCSRFMAPLVSVSGSAVQQHLYIGPRIYGCDTCQRWLRCTKNFGWVLNSSHLSRSPSLPPPQDMDVLPKTVPRSLQSYSISTLLHFHRHISVCLFPSP